MLNEHKVEEKQRLDDAKKLLKGYFGYPCVCKHPLDFAIINTTSAICLVCGKKL